MLLLGNQFYVANTDALMVFPYTAGATEIKDPGKKILDLPLGGYNNHWTRNIIASRDGKKIYHRRRLGQQCGGAWHGQRNTPRQHP